MKEKIEARIDELQALIKPLADEVATLRQELILIASPFKVGDIISWQNGRGRVVRVAEWVCGSPCWTVIRIRKDGTEGTKVTVYPFHSPIIQ